MSYARSFFTRFLAGFLFYAAGVLFAAEEKTVSLGGKAGWALVAEKKGVGERAGVRPYAVITLSSAQKESGGARRDPAQGFWSAASDYAGAPGALDLALSFDEADPQKFADRAGNYTVSVGSGVLAAKGDWVRQGAGAAFFPGVVTAGFKTGAAEAGNALRIRPRNSNALFSAGRSLDDFSIEFWVYPLTMERGEQLVTWNAALRRANTGGVQTISCEANRNRLTWNFNGFFTAPDGEESLSLTLSSKTTVLPKTWSHHLIRFDASAGLLEYVVNGVVEDLAYTTRTKKEGGEVFTPLAGERGSFSLGAQFNGIIDEFFIKEGASEAVARPRYAPDGGSFRTGPVRIAEWESAIVRINAAGGSVGADVKEGRAARASGGRFQFSGNAEIQFFMRAAPSAIALEDAPWTPFTPGEPLSGQRGCYAQIAANLYPSGDSERTPYLESVEIVYLPARAPPPPEYITAIARDGAVDLRWRRSSAPNVGGYLVYYGTRAGEYLGQEAGAGASPVDSGANTQARIDNLKNGTVYYFAVCAYDKTGPSRIGAFSEEVSARPLRMEANDK